MGGREARENRLSLAGERQQNLPPVGGAAPAADEALGLEAIDQTDGAVVPQTQAFGEISHGNGAPTGAAPYGEQRLMLLCRQSRLLCGGLAENQKLPDHMTKLGEPAEVFIG